MRPALMFLAVAAFGITAALTPGLDAAGAGEERTRTGEPHTATVRVVTYNVRHGLDNAVAVADVVRLAGRGADVIALQEMSSGKRRQALRERLVDCDRCPYDAEMAAVSPPGNLPILYRSKRFRLVDSGAALVSKETFVGKAGAGPARLPAKYVTYVGLRERTTGRILYVLNNHAVASVQARDGSANEANPERLRLYRRQMAVLQDLVTRFTARSDAVLVVGDLNVNYRRDKQVRDPLFPFVRLGAVGVRSSFQQLGEPARGTHELRSGLDTRLIDYIASTPRRTVRPVRQSVLLGFRSDHRPLLVDFALTRR